MAEMWPEMLLWSAGQLGITGQTRERGEGAVTAGRLARPGRGRAVVLSEGRTRHLTGPLSGEVGLL